MLIRTNFLYFTFVILILIMIYIFTNNGVVIKMKGARSFDTIHMPMAEGKSPQYKAPYQNENLSERNDCSAKRYELQGKLVIDEYVEDFAMIEERNKAIKPGGLFEPKECEAREKTAVLIPYRNRKNHLKILLNHLHPILQRQNLYYRIFVINQVGEAPFNRGMLFNIGFLEALKINDWNCFVFHDVDLLPENDFNIYNCADMPRHMSVAIDIMNYSLPYKKLFGGVSSMSTEQFKLVNGYPNRYWGWGGEDDDISKRIHIHGLSIKRYPITIARYKMLHHDKELPSRKKGKNLKNADRYDSFDGLQSIRYLPLSIRKMPLYTNITVNLIQPG